MVVLVWENKPLVYSNVQYILSDFFFFFLIYTLVFNFTHQQIGNQKSKNFMDFYCYFTGGECDIKLVSLEMIGVLV